eukprot:TRINITY_DN477_c0_g1_i2.p1 TRINITY_DN477_c0_g1~~TRINITY_DN477_c0_g1_i2.p1  ORF type:complete len:1361 (-),score=382.34 TRINITY_DN477_c0_g1_i2:229-4311(-)
MVVTAADITVQVALPDGGSKSLSIAQDTSVEDVKKRLWDLGGLPDQFASTNDFYLGFGQDDLVTVEFVNFVTCHDQVKKAIEAGSAVKISMFPLPSVKAVEEQIHRASLANAQDPSTRPSAAERHRAHLGMTKSGSAPHIRDPASNGSPEGAPSPLSSRDRADSLRDLKAKARELKSKSHNRSVANLIANQNAELGTTEGTDSPRSLFFDDWDSPPAAPVDATSSAGTSNAAASAASRNGSTTTNGSRSRLDSASTSSIEYKDPEDISSLNLSYGAASSSDSDRDEDGGNNDDEEEVQRFSVRLALPNGAYSVMSVTTETTVSELGMRVYAKAKYMLGSCPKNFRLKVNDNALHAASVLARIPYVKESLQNEVVPVIEFSTPESEAAKKEKEASGGSAEAGTGRASVHDQLAMVAERLKSLPNEQLAPYEITQTLGQLTTSDNSEVRAFRVTMKKIRDQALAYRRRPEFLMRANINCGKLPLGDEHRVKSVIVRLHYPNKDTSMSSVSKKVEVETSMRVSKVMAMCLEKANITSDPSQYLFKVTGLGEYFMGDEEFLMYDYVRRSLKAEQQIELNIVERPKPLEQDMIERDDVRETDETLAEAREFSHVETSISERPWNTLDHISIWDLERPFRVRLCGIDQLLQDGKNIHKLRRRAEQEGSQTVFFITAELYHSGHLIESARSSNVTCPVNPRWQEWLTYQVHTANLPKGTRLCLTAWGDTVKASSANVENVKGKKGGKETTDVKDTSMPLGWTNVQLVDHRSYLRAGLYSMKLWPDAAANPIGTCVENLVGTATMFLQFDEYPLPVIFPKSIEKVDDDLSDGRARSNTKKSKMDNVENKIEELITKDPLHVLAPEDVTLLWGVRHVLKNKPLALPKFLQSVNWVDRHAVQETHRLLAEWPKIPAMNALELLDSKFADEKVREYAVGCLQDMEDFDLAVVILQLTQVLKYEAYHDSALARFLMMRALRNPADIGHLFFWHLKSEMHMLEVVERFGLMLEEYLRGCGVHRGEILKQNEVLNRFGEIADMIKCEGTAESRLGILRTALGDLDIPWTIKLPLNPAMQVKDLRVDKCKYMDSKKRPLWLVFENGDPNGNPILVIFKSGDDLRQDQLTLQMIRLMDKLWQENGLDLKLKPYACVSTGDELGMLEVVLNAETTAAITRAAGGAAAAFTQTPLAKWLRVHNPSEEEWAKAVDTFVLSCAGYCVATYVLGIGDRHNDNVMLTKAGNLFHIDFGHFLGNFKKKFGIKREKAPFVFTPDFAYVMGGQKKAKPFKKFVDTCCLAYNILRRHADLFINLFCMMLSTGIPELTCVDDIEYLRTAFLLGKSDAQAAKKFQKLIKQSLKTTTTQVNNAIHILAH